ncbi:MAG: type II secretion system F family protein [Alphaproteobacteria bacterium]|nr:type II secretion system F family protein [Alphaproteobacteria bacterium]
MPAYSYRAVHASGRIARGRIAAANEYELAHSLGASGLELIVAQEQKESPVRLRWPRRVAPRAVEIFCSQMADLLKAGVPFVDSLRETATAAESGPMRDALTDITRAINHGSRIAHAFACHGRLFPSVFISILAAGEATGDLARTFGHLTRYAATQARTRDRMHRALRYPLFLIAVVFAVVGFMMTLVVPQVIQFLNSIDSELPVMTRLLIAVSDIFAATWWLMAAGFFGVIALLGLLRQSSSRATQIIDGIALRLPLAGPVLQKQALSRFMHSFSILFASGVGILGSLRSARPTLGNHAMETALEEAERCVVAGQSLSQAMADVLPSFAQRIIRIGEQSGALGKNLNDIAEIYDREAAEVTDRMIGALEPTLTILIGGLLAWIVMAVLGPIYGSLGKIV